MGIFRRSTSRTGADDLSTLLMQGEDMIGQLGDAHSRTWGLGTADRWDLDQAGGLITWTFPDRTATAPAQILGSYNPSAESWMWAWANSSILPAMSRDAAAVRDWGEEHGVEALTQPKVDCDADMANTLIALAVRITEAAGFYKGGSSGVIPIITFGPVTLTGADGSTQTVQIELS